MMIREYSPILLSVGFLSSIGGVVGVGVAMPNSLYILIPATLAVYMGGWLVKRELLNPIFKDEKVDKGVDNE